ncbi:response regulator receiver domain [Marinobacter salarius]|uniref:response regulator receiver domain n=1 Tax=Marinobacter salarius TaxID=1420917 RepID=UPI0029426AC4|nr:response regulator receiver domain [Marinobacter salarius]WOI20923.1 response regulator receiver domain [Marinobacter salarius]
MIEPVNNFDDLCSNAVKAFLQTVVVIDNEASLASDASINTNTEPTAATQRRPSAPGKVKATEKAAVDPRTQRERNNNPAGHRLELNKVSQAFAGEGLTCGVYLPTETDPADDNQLLNATVRAILPTDACVLDWQLRKGNSRPATEAIKQVLNTDKAEGGRLRLILIYTAEKLEGASTTLAKALVSEGYEIKTDSPDTAPVIIGDHFRITFINKPTLGRNPSDDPAVVPWNLLPQRMIKEFTILARGLLRAFALESVAAVKRDIHRILAQFDEELDPVYAGDRATKPDPNDAGRLMVEVLQSELSLSIDACQAEQKVLGLESCMLWLHSRAGRLPQEKPVSAIKRTGELPKIKSINTETRKLFLTDGFRDVSSADGKHASVSCSFFDNEEKWKQYSSDYAVLTTIARHSGERAGRPPGESPSLQFGTIIGSHEQTLLCIQPACDTVRLRGETGFLFLKLIPEDSEFDLVLPGSGNGTRYQIPDGYKFKHLRELTTVHFKPLAEKDVILARNDDDGIYNFTDACGAQWKWRAQLREMTAVHLAQKALHTIGRIGSNEFEWLRTSAK